MARLAPKLALCAACALAATTAETFYTLREAAVGDRPFTLVLSATAGMSWQNGTTVTLVKAPANCDGTVPPVGLQPTRGYFYTAHDAEGWVVEFRTLPRVAWGGAVAYVCVGPDPATVGAGTAGSGASINAASWDGTTYVADPNAVFVFASNADTPHYTVLPATAIAAPSSVVADPPAPQRLRYQLRVTLHHTAPEADVTLLLAADPAVECKLSNGLLSSSLAGTKEPSSSAMLWTYDVTTAAAAMSACLTVDGGNSWTAVPHATRPPVDHTMSSAYAPVFSFPVYARVLTDADPGVDMLHVECQAALIAGHETICSIGFLDSSGNTASASGIDVAKVEISSLVDGNGDVICPLPEIDSGTMQFTFRPLHAGRTASIRLTYDGVPVPLKAGVDGWIANAPDTRPKSHPGTWMYHDTTVQPFWVDQTYLYRDDVVQETASGEEQALRDLYTATGGARWVQRRYWNGNTDPCGQPWQGVVCELNRVVELRLPHNNLDGTLPPLGGLPHLRVLDLHGNRITGALTDFPDTLRVLNVDDNLLTSIDKAAASFTTLRRGSCLRHLSAARNALTALPTDLFVSGHDFVAGTPPASPVVYPWLEHVDLSSNAIQGTLADLDATRAPLRRVNLGRNELSGALPKLVFPARPHPSTLQALDVSHNAALSSEIPTEYGALAALTVLELTHLDLHGAVPASLHAVHRLRDLRVFIGGNRLSGLLPSWVAHVRKIDLRRNGFTCPLPSSLARPHHMQGLQFVRGLDYCDLSAVP